jgi:hypothetical protein
MKDFTRRNIVVTWSRGLGKFGQPHLCAACLLLLYAVVGVVYSLRLGEQLRFPDEHDYLKTARHLAARGTYTLDGNTPSAYRAPGYPLVLSVALLSGGDIAACRLLNVGLLCLTMAGLFRLVTSHASPGAGLLAGLFAMGYPVLLYTAGTFYPQTQAACLFVWTVHVFFRRGASYGSRFAVGLMTGWLILTVPTFIFTLFFLLVWTAWGMRSEGLKRAGLLLAGAMLVVLPWTIRNAVVLNALVPVSTNSGISLFTGNSEGTRPNAGVNIEFPAPTATPINEVGWNRYYTQEAIRFMRENPGRALRLYVAKFLNYFNYRNELRTANETSPWRRLVMLLTYGPLLALLVLRLALWRRWPPGDLERFAVLLYLLNGAFAAIYFTRIRFRLPFDYLLIALAAITCFRLCSAIATRKAAGQTAQRNTDCGTDSDARGALAPPTA